MAQTAALAALGDQPFLAEIIGKVERSRDRIAGIAAARSLASVPSATNFVAIDCGGDGALAMKIMQELIARDVFVRKPMAPGLDRCIRVSVGPERDLDIFETEFPHALAAARTGA